MSEPYAEAVYSGHWWAVVHVGNGGRVEFGPCATEAEAQAEGERLLANLPPRQATLWEAR